VNDAGLGESSATMYIRSRRSPTVLQITTVLCIAFLLLLAPSGGTAQPRLHDVATIAVPLEAWIASRPHALPETLPSFETTSDRVEKFRAMLEALLAHDFQQAAGQAKSISYELVMIREEGSTFLIASDNSGTGRDPTVVLNLNARRDFIVGAPHVPFEQGTGEQAVIFLRDLAGRAAIISGAHRWEKQMWGQSGITSLKR
jgi:hypothetical protein